MFRLQTTPPQCEPEQRALFNGGFTDALQQVYRTCVIGTASQTGRWSVQILDENTGAGVAALTDGYMWGFTDRLLPGGKLSLIVEPFTAPTPFARPSDSPSAMNVYELHSSATWQLQKVAAFPVTGRPSLRMDIYDANPRLSGQNMIGKFWDLRTRPNSSATGLVDLLLENGRWIGFSPTTGTIITK